MAVIAQNILAEKGITPLLKTTLSASDTLIYTQSSNQRLIIENDTGSSVTVNIDGDAATSVPVPNTGATFDVSSGLNITVADGDAVFLTLDQFKAYLVGTITVTGAPGAVAYIIK